MAAILKLTYSVKALLYFQCLINNFTVSKTVDWNEIHTILQTMWYNSVYEHALFCLFLST